MTASLDESLLVEIEAQAALMAREAGAILRSHFGKALEVEYKKKGEQDPVTVADKASQEYLKEAISSRFPDHGIVAEEEKEEASTGGAAPDYVWALDPLDGTTNFLNGLPLYAVSIGVLYRGTPVTGALFIPWPVDGGGVVLHARRGGGAFADQEAISVFQTPQPKGNRLTGLPASFGAGFRFRKGMRGKVGDARTTGSIAYELALTARGVLQYAVHTAPRIWDVAGGALVVLEAGGAVMVRHRKTKRWEPLSSFLPSWESGRTTLQEVRRWSAPMISGSPQIAQYVASNLRIRLLLRHRLARIARRLATGPQRASRHPPGHIVSCH